MGGERFRRVIFITVDRVSYERLGFACGQRGLTPTFDDLAATGISCAHAYTHSFATQFSFPAIFTSTLPLDYGGYDKGIRERPVSLPEIFASHGYQTVGFSPDYVLHEFYGYERGFDEFYLLFDPDRFLFHIQKNFVTYYIRLAQEGVITSTQFDAYVSALMQDIFDFLAAFASRMERQWHQIALSKIARTWQYDWVNLQAQIKNWQTELRRNPSRFIAEIVPHLTLARTSLYHGNNETKFASALKKNIKPHVSKAYQETYHLARDPRALGAIAGIDVTQLDRRHAEDAPTILGRALTWLDRHPAQNAFMWLALVDPHELTLAAHIVSPSLARSGLRQFKRRNRVPKYFTYDLSLSFVDRALGRFIRELKTRNLLEDTLLVLCSDHGAGTIDDRNNYENFMYRVPMIFWNPHLRSKTIQSLCGLIDLTPTVVDLMGWGQDPSFRGEPVYSTRAAERDHLVLEDLDAGPCDWEHKKPRLCIMGKTHKYIATEQDTSFMISAADVTRANHAATPERFHTLAQERLKTLAPFA